MELNRIILRRGAGDPFDATEADEDELTKARHKSFELGFSWKNAFDFNEIWGGEVVR